MSGFKQFFKEVLSWIGSFFYLLYWLAVHCFRSDFKNHVNKESCGGTIDIIVNGPSFAKQVDIVKNDGFDKCMVNFAANTPLFWVFKPKYYCVADPAFFSGSARKDAVDVFIDSIRRVDWDLTFFVTYRDYKRHIKNTDLNHLPHVRFVPYHGTPLPFSFRFKKLAFWLFRNGQAMPNPMSVSIPVIMNAINTGYANINLYGFDQDWIHNIIVDENNNVCHQDTHFYNEKGTLNLWKKNEHETFRVYEILQSQVELFESYWFIREYVDYLGDIKVINRSPKSLLDAFDRK